MLEIIRSAFDEYIDGVEDKSGTTALEVIAAQVRMDITKQNQMIPILLDVLAKMDTSRPKFWEAFVVFIGKFDCKSQKLAVSIENLLPEAGRPEDQFFAIRSLALTGFDVTPKFLARQVALQTARPALWFDLAIDAFAGDIIGLTEATVQLVRAVPSALAWTDLRRRLPKLRDGLQTRFNSFARQIGWALPNSEDRTHWFTAIDGRYGSKLALDNPSSGAREGADGSALATAIKQFATQRMPPVVHEVVRFRDRGLRAMQA